MGGTYSYSKSTEDVNENVSQTFYGACDASAASVVSGVNASGTSFDVNQTTGVNGTCFLGASLNSVTDVLQKAQNSAAAASAGILSWGTSDTSISKSKSLINLNVQNTVNEKCNTSSLSEFVNSTIKVSSSIVINQDTNTSSNCSLEAVLSATSNLQQFASNSATSGKVAVKKGDKASMIASIVGIVVIIGLIAGIGMLISKHNKDKGAVPGSGVKGISPTMPSVPSSGSGVGGTKS